MRFRILLTAFLISAMPIIGFAGQIPGHLNRANTAEPESLDPQLVHTLPGIRVVADLFDGLIERNSQGKIVPAQAESWTTSEDGRTWTFNLRKSQWSDGQPVVANDFVQAWQRAVDPATGSPYAWYLEMMSINNAKAIVNGEMPASSLGIKALSPSKLAIELEHPVPWLLEMMVMPVLYPVPAKTIEKYGKQWTAPEHIVTNGPYAMQDWVVNEKITLKANSKHPDRNQLGINSVSYLPLSSDMAAFNRYRAGDVDMTLNIPLNFYEKLVDERPDELRVTHTLGTEYYAFNTRRAPFNNAKLRKALSLAVDREKITGKVLGEGQVPAYNFTPLYTSQMPEYKSDIAKLSRDERLKEARRLYREAGYSKKNPLRFSLVYNTSESRQKVAIAIASMWKVNLGVEVELENMEWKSVIARIRARDFDVARASWVADFNSPISFLAIFAGNSSSNKPGFQNTQYDNILGRMNTPNIDRQPLFSGLEDILGAETPIIPLYHYVTPQLVSPRVEGWYDNPRDMVMTRYLSLKKEAKK
ncbi:peptide ABC transporter substrate-binding protein [Sansalvadorimonas sp. 2012CJ34-2]|uniref:Peptide ABC transporter substrate-binding protein n=1 Tax=Parendozoicomonas callyspongiae TaxID=2942213 RepID=A0ABT0PJ84_9GAMM|nr:peptide ABC transporter substrate-binding protein [Sansalvadorimonas sp. 2012CJ34-2]MCL6270538.1 peptide ABC transporter substrate-binding protein [Sansalvadorimonas sp. 2012CJ34-2]